MRGEFESKWGPNSVLRWPPSLSFEKKMISEVYVFECRSNYRKTLQACRKVFFCGWKGGLHIVGEAKIPAPHPDKILTQFC